VGEIVDLLSNGEIGYKPKMIGGGMVGLQVAATKIQLGPLLDGFINYEFWLPIPKMNYPGAAEFLGRYQARAAAAGVVSATSRRGPMPNCRCWSRRSRPL
jgi:hypothetical protein